MIFLILYPLLAMITVLLLIPAVRGPAIKARLVDRPGGRKQHRGAVPLIGGVVIVPVFIVLSIVSGVPLAAYWPLFLALIVLLVTGVLDDRFGIRAWIKFSMQGLAAFLIVVPGDALVLDLGNMLGLGIVEMGVFALPFSLFCTVLLINAINLMDGLDGLAAGKSFVVLAWFLLACVIAGIYAPVLPIGILLGAIGGFLYYNMRHPLRKKAGVFLGDAGSMCLGLILAWYSIGLARGPEPIVVPISVAWIVALPVIDACGQFVRRAWQRKHPFTPDRGHFHHHFVHAGIPMGQSTVMILAWGFALGAIGYFGVLMGVPSAILTLGWVALLFSHVAMTFRPQKLITFLERFRKIV